MEEFDDRPDARELPRGRGRQGQCRGYAELKAYYADLERFEAAALWTVANKIEPWEPKSDSQPVLWRYQDLRNHVLRSIDLVSPEKAGRRVIYLNNPGRRDVAAACGWLYSGLQVMKPGEVASAHQHSASALRFIMEGKGAYTIVDGHKMTLGENDFVLTPNGSWHEHGVAADGTECIWQDGLDIPLVNCLEANFYAVHADLKQQVAYPVDNSTASWGAPGLQPAGADWSKPYSPMLKYEWEPTYEALNALCQGNRRLAVRWRADELYQSANRRPGHADHWRIHADAASRREDPRPSPHRLVDLSGSQGLRLFDHRRQAIRLEAARYFLCTCLGIPRARQRVGERGCLPVLFQRFPVMNALGLYREEAFGENQGSK